VLPARAFTASGFLGVGNATGLTGSSGAARSAVDFTAWGFQCEVGATVSPYIATTTAAQTRVREVAYVTLPTAPNTTGVHSIAATFGTTKTSSGAVFWQGWTLDTAGTVPAMSLYGAGTTLCQVHNGTAVNASRAALAPFTNTRFACFNDGVNQQGVYAGVAFATPGVGTRTAPDATRLYLGGDPSAGYEINDWIGRVVVETTATGAR